MLLCERIFGLCHGDIFNFLSHVRGRAHSDSLEFLPAQYLLRYDFSSTGFSRSKEVFHIEGMLASS